MSQWFLVRVGQEQGPLDDAQLKKLAADGILRPDDVVRRKDSPTGTPAKNIKGLFTPSAASSSGVAKRPPPPPARIETLASPPPLPEWHYAQNNEQHGPVTFSQLKDLASSGRLRSTDLVWKVGTPNWREARTIDDLFAAVPTSETRSAAGTSPQPTADAKASGVAPALWNPSVIRVLGFIFTWGVGAFLLARNWKALGETERAQRSMMWFYSIFAWLLFAIVSPDTETVSKLFKCAWLVILICWVYFDAQPQIKYVKERFGNNYPRKGWLGQSTTSKASNWKKLLAGCFLFAVVFVVIVAVSEERPSPAVRKAPSRSDAFMDWWNGGPKLAAFKNVVQKYREIPDRLAPESEESQFLRELQKVQKDFFDLPFDPAANRQEARAIIELYEKEIEHRYSGNLAMALEEHIARMYGKLRSN